MANLGSGGGTGYPSAIDTQSPPESSATLARSDVPNDLAAAVIAIEKELGTSPSGAKDDVVSFLQEEHEVDGSHGSITPTKVTMAGSFSFLLGTTASSAAALDLGEGNIFEVAGTIGISSINTKGIGVYIILRFQDVLTLTDDGNNLQLQNDLVTKAGTVIALYEYNVGKWRLVSNSSLSTPLPVGDVTPNTIDGTVIKATTRLEGPLGSTNPATVKATTFEGDAGGTTINEFSTDGTLAGNSDDAVPTERAVKTFVDNLPAGAFENQLFHVRDEKSNGSDGGTFTSGVYRTRNLNTVKTNEIVGASLGSDQLTLPAGTYYIEADAPALGVDFHKAKLRNITLGSDILVGYSCFTDDGFQGNNLSRLVGRFTLAGVNVLEIQHRCSKTLATFGFGPACSFGEIEVYTAVQIWKVG